MTEPAAKATIDRTEPRPRVLVLAFACDPRLGSEPGAGWAMVRTAAEVAEVTALVSDYHMPSIESWLADHPEHADVRFVPVGAASEGSWIRRLIGLDRRAWFLDYLRWLRSAAIAAKRLHAEQPFDGSLHAAYGSYWLPTPLVELDGVPCVWGPVGGATTTPWRLWRYLGLRGWLGELQKLVAIRLATAMPSVRKTWELASVRLLETRESLEALPRRYRADGEVLNRVLLYDLPDFANGEPVERKPFILFPSLLEPRKGPMLAVEALAHTPEHVRLVFVNDGYSRTDLERAAKRLGLTHRVEFLGRIPRTEMFRMMREASAVVFTGLREEGGMALAEAMISGAPVVVLAHGGPRLIAEHALDPARVAAVRPGSARATVARLGAAMSRFVTDAPGGLGSNLEQDSTKQRLQAAILRAVERCTVPSMSRPREVRHGATDSLHRRVES